MKRFSRAVSFVLAVLLVFSASGLTINAMAISSDEPDVTKGNVPVTFTPNSEITFDADGNYEITNVGTPLPVSRSTGEEIGGNLVDQDPDAYDAANQAMLEQFESLPVFMFEEYYIAGEGAVALYDQDGELIRVRGDYEYYSTLDQYMVNGSLPDGKYIGTYSEFSQITNKSNDSRAVASTITQSGRFTTYGDYWPVIDETEWPDCNTDPVPNGPVYGDRIGTKNNRLEVGDVALKKSAGVPYDSKSLSLYRIPTRMGMALSPKSYV